MSRKFIIRRHWDEEISEDDVSDEDHIFGEDANVKVPKSGDICSDKAVSHLLRPEPDSQNAHDEVDMAVQRSSNTPSQSRTMPKYGNQFAVPQLYDKNMVRKERTGKRKSTSFVVRSSMRNSDMTPYVLPAIGMDRQDRKLRRHNTLQDKHEYYENLPPFGFLDFIGCIICIFSFLADVGTDVFVAILYFSSDRYTLFGLTVSFIIVPAIVTSCFSIVWYIQDSKHYKKYGFNVSVLRWILRILFHLLQIGPVLRYIDILRYGVKSRLSAEENSRERRHYIEIMLNEDSDTALLRLLECFMEAAPQLTLQLYIISRYGGEFSSIPIIRIGQISSCITSLASLSWALTSYHKSLRLSLPDKAKITYFGMAIQFIWRFLTIGCRVLALALFASKLTIWVFVVAGCHWMVMLVGLLLQKTNFCDGRMKNARCQEVFFNMVMAAVYIYSFVNVKEGHTRLRYLMYYVIMYAENLGMVLFWYMFAHTDSAWYLQPSMVLIVGGFFLGIVFQIIYYIFLHPNNFPPYDTHYKIKWCITCDEAMNIEIERSLDVDPHNQAEGHLLNGHSDGAAHKPVPSSFV